MSMGMCKALKKREFTTNMQSERKYSQLKPIWSSFFDHSSITEQNVINVILLVLQAAILPCGLSEILALLSQLRWTNVLHVKPPSCLYAS